jgi:hypothetical protein
MGSMGLGSWSRAHPLQVAVLALLVVGTFATWWASALIFVAFLGLAAVTWIPWLGSRVLGVIGWAALPAVGGLAGFKASGVLVTAAVAVMIAGTSFGPRAPERATTGNVAAGAATSRVTITAPTSSPASAVTPSPLSTATPIVTASPSITPSPSPTPATTPSAVAFVATAIPTQRPATPAPTAPPTPKPAPPTVAPAKNLCGAPANPWDYSFCAGSFITAPPANFCNYFNCIASFWNGRGYVMECSDTTYGKSGGISGSCSQHGGNFRALRAP